MFNLNLNIRETHNGFIVSVCGQRYEMGDEWVFETPAGLSKFILEQATLRKADMKRKAKEKSDGSN